MADPVMHIQMLVRAEMAVAQIRANRATSKMTFIAIALVLGLIALAMLNVAGFFALAPSMGYAMAAFVTALANIVLVVILLVMANNAGPSENEERLANELRDMAYAELNSDIQPVKDEIISVAEDVKRIRNGFSMLSHAGSGGGAASLLPLLGALLGALKKK